MGLNLRDRKEIIECKHLFTSTELAKIFDVPRGQITRVWYDELRGIKVIPRTGRSEKPETIFDLVFGKRNAVIRDAEPPPPEPIVGHGKTLEQLAAPDCRWIIGKDIDGDWRYCACERAAGLHRQVKMYCRAHAAKALEVPENAMVSPVEIGERMAHPASPAMQQEGASEFIYAPVDLVTEIKRNKAQFDRASRYFSRGPR